MINLKNSILNVKDKKSKVTSKSVRNSNGNKSFDFSNLKDVKTSKGIQRSINIANKLNKNMNTFENELMVNKINNMRYNKSRSISKHKKDKEDHNEFILTKQRFDINNQHNQHEITNNKRLVSSESFIEENNV